MIEEPSERALSDPRLRESEDRFRTVIEAVSDAIIVADPETLEIRICNQRVAQLTGWTVPELRAMTIADIHPAEEMSRLQAGLLRALPDGDGSAMQIAVLRRDRSLAHLEVSSHSFALDGQRLAMIVYRDNAVESRIEREIQEREQTYRDLIENASEAILVISVDGSFQYANRRVAQMAGYAPEDLVGRRMIDHVHPDDRARLRDRFSRRIAGEQLSPTVCRVLRKDGTPLWVELSSAMTNWQGRPAVLSFFTDLTERRRAEEALERSEESFNAARRRTEEALRVSEELYRSHFEHVSDLVYLIDHELVIRSVSPSLREILGIDPQAVIGRSLEELTAVDARVAEDAARLGRGILEGQPIGTLEYQVPDARGQIKTLEIRSNRIAWRNGLAIAGIARDVTEQRRASEAIRNSRAMLESIFRAAPVGVGMAANRVLLEVNDNYCDMLGYTREELIGTNARVLYPTDAEYMRVDADFYQQIADSGTGSIQTRWRCKDGRVIDVMIRGAAIDTSNSTAGIAFSVLDITEQLRAQDQIRKRKEAFQAVYDVVTGNAASLEGTCDEAAATLARLLGVDHVIIERFHDGQCSILARSAEGRISTGESTSIVGTPREVVFRTGQPYRCSGDLAGSYPADAYLATYPRLTSYSGTPIKTNRGSVIGSLSVFFSSRRPLDDDALHLLEIFARYLGIEIERQQIETRLRETSKGELLSVVASGVAHEVRNPLHAIQAISEALFHDIGESPAYKEYIHHIQTQVERLSQLMNDLLELGKPLQPASLRIEPVHHLCAEAVEYWKESKPGSVRQVIFEDRPRDPALGVRVDQAKIHQVLINLLDNAHEHSPEDHPITVWIDREGTEAVTVGVSDLGTGIPPNIVDRIFEPFFTTRRKGTGLGLSLCQHIVGAHGGSIRVSNHTDRAGCTVEFTIKAVPLS